MDETLYVVQFEMDGSLWSGMAIVEERQPGASFADMIDLTLPTSSGDRQFLIHKLSLRAMYMLGGRQEWGKYAKQANNMLFQPNTVQFISNVMGLLGAKMTEEDIGEVKDDEESSGNGE